MADTIVQIAHGNLYIKTGSAQDALLILHAAEQYLLKGEDHMEIAEMEIDSLSMDGTAPEAVQVHLDPKAVAEAIVQHIQVEEEEGE